MRYEGPGLLRPETAPRAHLERLASVLGMEVEELEEFCVEFYEREDVSVIGGLKCPDGYFVHPIAFAQIARGFLKKKKPSR